MKHRLQKIIASSGISSRRKAEAFIVEGRVTVNGLVVSDLGSQADPDKDIIAVDGVVLKQQKHVYYLFNKPKGVVTTLHDEKGRPSIIDFTKQLPIKVFPVGRLDEDTTGLLLLTNDGELANKLVHPKHEIEKIYEVTIQGILKDEDKKRLELGVRLRGQKTSPARIFAMQKDSHRKETRFSIAIHEGRNRQIRSMCGLLGYPVISLNRAQFGPLTLGDLKSGLLRELTQNERESLQKASGLI